MDDWKLGEYNELTILRSTDYGLFLGGNGDQSILLPNKYCPEKYELGDQLKVFVYLDHEERPVATNILPRITLNKFALLQVVSITPVGIFLDWGLEKELLHPYNEQQKKMEEGRWYVVYLDLDKETNRLFASSRIEKHLEYDDLTVEEGQEVEVLVWKKTDMGYSVIINHIHEGLVYANEIFGPVNIGDKIKGYIKKIREDKKIDVSLNPIGYGVSNDQNIEIILDELKQAGGCLDITDKSSPEAIYTTFRMSKKTYKKAIGALYKRGEIELLPTGIKLL